MRFRGLAQPLDLIKLISISIKAQLGYPEHHYSWSWGNCTVLIRLARQRGGSGRGIGQTEGDTDLQASRPQAVAFAVKSVFFFFIRFEKIIKWQVCHRIFDEIMFYLIKHLILFQYQTIQLLLLPSIFFHSLWVLLKVTDPGVENEWLNFLLL